MEGTETLQLIRRSLAGDETAFAALFHQYKNLVYKTAFVLLGSKDEADDALQDVFLDVHRALASYQPSKGAFSTWLYRVTVNHCLSWRRKRKFLFFSLDEGDAGRSRAGKGTAHLESGLPRGLHHAAHATNHEEQVEIADQVLKAMSHLSPKLRAVVALRYYRDLSYAEIATILNVPIGTVKSRLCQAMETLRTVLESAAADAIADAVAQDLLPREAKS